MTVCTYKEAQSDLLKLLRQALAEGEVKILGEGNRAFILRPDIPSPSPLDVPGMDLGLTTAEIVDCIHEARTRPRQEQ
jgi:hypothetical protein